MKVKLALRSLQYNERKMSPDEKVTEFFSQFPQRTYPKGQVLLFPNQNPDSILYIVSGKVRCYGLSYRGDEVVLNILANKAFFPMSWAISKVPNYYYYRTETETIAYVAPPDEVYKFVTENPDVLLDLISRLYRGVEGMRGRLLQMMSGSAKMRVLYELMIETKRFGIKQEDGAYQLAISETDLAARTGLSRETVSREAQKLKELKWLAVTGKTLKVLQIDEIEDCVRKNVK